MIQNEAMFNQALQVGRPPNIQTLFPNSRALIVSGKVIDRALITKGKAMTIAANARNRLIIRGALQAAQKANAAIIIEIAKSEGGRAAYCAVNYWNLATYVDQICNELEITIPVAIHADHYSIKNDQDIENAKLEIPTLFEAGITSIAIDASHLPDDRNLLANIALSAFIPAWAGLETEVGEIKGKVGLTTLQETQFLIQGLNAHHVFPDWIALNNGTVHGIEASDAGIQVDLTASIHEGIGQYHVSGAQHGTSGNSTQRLKDIARKTATTKANVATALQMLSWGVEVNNYGNAILDENRNVKKQSDKGVADYLWEEMLAYADKKGLSGGNLKKLSLPFDNQIMSQPEANRKRSIEAVEAFVYHLLVNVFNAEDTAPLAIDAIVANNSYLMPPKAERLEEPEEWTEEKIMERGSRIANESETVTGDFDD